jgi:hypothetical protein
MEDYFPDDLMSESDLLLAGCAPGEPDNALMDAAAEVGRVLDRGSPGWQELITEARRLIVDARGRQANHLRRTVVWEQVGNRENDMKFRKGESGNPGGRPKVLGEVQELARQYAPTVIVELARLALRAKNETARIAAIRELLDRGYGKPRQALEVSAPVGDPLDPLRLLFEEIDEMSRRTDRYKQYPKVSGWNQFWSPADRWPKLKRRASLAHWQDKDGCVLDHPGLERGTRMPFGSMTRFILFFSSTPIDDHLFKKRPTVPSPHGLRSGNGRDAEAGSSTPRH